MFLTYFNFIFELFLHKSDTKHHIPKLDQVEKWPIKSEKFLVKSAFAQGCRECTPEKLGRLSSNFFLHNTCHFNFIVYIQT